MAAAAQARPAGTIVKSAAAREARQVARVHVDGWWATRVPNTVIAARLAIPQDVRSAYNRLNHRERGRARARWRALVAAKRSELCTRRDARTDRRLIQHVTGLALGRTYHPS